MWVLFSFIWHAKIFWLLDEIQQNLGSVEFDANIGATLTCKRLTTASYGEIWHIQTLAVFNSIQTSAAFKCQHYSYSADVWTLPKFECYIQTLVLPVQRAAITVWTGSVNVCIEFYAPQKLRLNNDSNSTFSVMHQEMWKLTIFDAPQNSILAKGPTDWTCTLKVTFDNFSDNIHNSNLGINPDIGY